MPNYEVTLPHVMTNNYDNFITLYSRMLTGYIYDGY